MLKYLAISTGAFALILAVCIPAYSDIYMYVDKNGVVCFTNIPRGEGYRVIISEDSSGHEMKDKGYSKEDILRIIHSKARKYNIEPSLIKAIITAESNWRPEAVSHRGAIGLMQLMPVTIKEMRLNNPFDPEENIEGGIRYLKSLIDRFDGDLALALAAYNAGPNTVKRFGRIPPIPETERYVKNVLTMYKGKSRRTTIYKVIFNDGTILYTNTPSRYRKFKLSEF